MSESRKKKFSAKCKTAGRRGDDNLFILTSAIEMSRRQLRGLMCCFLDCTKAYDRIRRELLWERLDYLGMDPRWIELLKDIYADNHVVVKLEEFSSEKLSTKLGLRQGCP